jgi:hypothetical protein
MEELQNPISRRRMLKRVGAGAAVAWSAPILSSLRTPAFAQDRYPPPCAEPCDATCETGFPQCGSSGPLGGCFCSRAQDGSCFCWENDFCANRPDVSQAGACPEGQTAVSTCCDQVFGTAVKCWNPCGTEATSAVSSGPTGARV